MSQLESFLFPHPFRLGSAVLIHPLPARFAGLDPGARLGENLGSKVQDLMRAKYKMPHPWVLVTEPESEKPVLSVKVLPSTDLSQLARDIADILERT
jgi:hypothetical protein